MQSVYILCIMILKYVTQFTYPAFAKLCGKNVYIVRE